MEAVLQLNPQNLTEGSVPAELRALMGDPRADQIMTLHLVIRPLAAVKSSGMPCVCMLIWLCMCMPGHRLSCRKHAHAVSSELNQ